MKYRVGDKVRVQRIQTPVRYYMGKSSKRNYPRYPTAAMCVLAGLVLTIATANRNGYTVEEMPDCVWTDEMFEPVFEIGDRVRCLYHPHRPYSNKTGVVVKIAEDYGYCPCVRLDKNQKVVSYLPCDVELIRDDPPKYRATFTSDGTQAIATIFKDNKKIEEITIAAAAINESKLVECIKRAFFEFTG